MRVTTKLLLLLVFVTLQCLPVTCLGGCDSAPTYLCPNCDGEEVTDCQRECAGFLSTDTQSGLCIDRQLFHQFLWNDLVAMVIWFVAAGVAISCGVGGGGIYVPLGVLILQFAPKQASGLSQCSIFGAALGGLFLNLRNLHPIPVRNEASLIAEDGSRVTQRDYSKKETMELEKKGERYFTRPVINYDMVLFLAPMEMGGALLGVTIQRVLPNWLFLLCASIVLGFTGYKTYEKALRTRENENAKFATLQVADETDTSDDEMVENRIHHFSTSDEEEKKDDGAEGEDESSKEEPLPMTDACEDERESDDLKDNNPSSHSSHTDESAEMIALREEYLIEDQQQFPRKKFLTLALLWIVLFVLTLTLGGSGSRSIIGITCDDPWFYGLLALQFVWLFGFSGFYAIVLMKKQKRLDAVHYPVLQEDIMWDARAVSKFGISTCLVGFMTGMIGISGGMILNPVIIYMGMNPVVSSATTATMLVLTSSSIAIMAITTGLVPWSYAVLYFVVTLTGALLGKSQIDRFVRRTGRASVLVFLLASIITFASIGVLVIMMLRVSSAGWCLEGFQPFCVAPSSSDAGECPTTDDRLLY